MLGTEANHKHILRGTNYKCFQRLHSQYSAVEMKHRDLLSLLLTGIYTVSQCG